MPDDIDFSALDPRGEGDFDARVARIASDAMKARDGLRAPVAPSGVVSTLTSWARPIVLAAGLLLAITLGTLASTSGSSSSTTPASSTDALGLPRPLAEILHSTTPPSLAELDGALASISAR